METSKIKVGVTALGLIGAAYLYWRGRVRLRDAAEALKCLDVQIITSEESCDKIVNVIESKIKHHRALGFDCEWVSEKGARHSVALIQLSTIDGFCGLFRLNKLKCIPSSLQNLLEDKSIYKVGVAPLGDAKLLLQDFNVQVTSTLDLRHIAQYCGYNPGGLANLSKNLLRILLDKSWRIRCSDWEAETLTPRQVTYSAADAHVAIKILEKLMKEFHSISWWSNIFNNHSQEMWNKIDDVCSNYADIEFKNKNRATNETNDNKRSKSAPKLKESKRYPYATRSKPLYNNCYLEAPDGELLCTCDNKKALWYVEKSLADIVEEGEPLRVRLRFEPRGRSVGDAGRFYQIGKINRCVVCGSDNSYIRKNVVPREYRKYFPELMKEHSSHDVVLLCTSCHQRSNILDQPVRERLAVQCDAPLSGNGDNGCKYIIDKDHKKSRSYAYTLLKHKDPKMIPEDRRKHMESVILNTNPGYTEVSDELLREVAYRDPVIYENEDYECHGQKVVEHYMAGEGMLRLEELWREHFLNSMRPRYMPPFWSIKHNEDRMRVKFEEGRLSQKDIETLGLTKWINIGLIC